MYLFVFLWVPSLQEATISTDALPLGYIFSCFMVSMMLGSLLYTTVISYSQKSPVVEAQAREELLMVNAKLSSLVCATSSVCFALAVTLQSEHTRFWAFCVFETCVGMYYPVQGMLRGTLISNEHRATVSVCFHPTGTNIYRGFLALVPLPCPPEHLCGGIPPHRCFLCKRQGSLGMRCYARSLVYYDR